MQSVEGHPGATMHNLAAVGQRQTPGSIRSVNRVTVSGLITFYEAHLSAPRLKDSCSVRLRRSQKGEPSRWKLLIWTAVASLIFGLIGAGELPEDMLRVSRNLAHVHKASGDIVLVAIDDRSLREVGQWPWARRHHANL